MPSEACTMSGAVQFGSTSLNISRDRAGAADAGGGDVVLRGLGDDRRAGEAHVVRQDDERDGEHGVHQPGPEDRRR